jgi:hypothetical protein
MTSTIFMLYVIYLTHPQDNMVLGTAPKHSQCVALKRHVTMEKQYDAIECIEVTNDTLKAYLDDEKFWRAK